jgi:hypothetical protein
MIEYYRPAGDGGAQPALQYDFETPSAAREQIEREVDVQALDATYRLGGHAELAVSSESLADNRFTNIYDLSFAHNAVAAEVHVERHGRSVADYLANVPEATAAISGAFLYLADQGSGTPRQQALNLAVQKRGYAASLPVVDREALLADIDGRLSVRFVRALGELSINNHTVTWSGSRSAHPAECSVFGNGNVVIRHAFNEEVGARKQRIRILDEHSRYSPLIAPSDERVDVGLLASSNGCFQAVGRSASGGLDLFAYDTVLRCNPRLLRSDGQDDIQFRSVDTLPLDSSIQGAISVGPFLTDSNFASNPINDDPSLGSDPPFINVPMVRLAVYQSTDERTHITLFDGRPESSTFQGVTPAESVAYIFARHKILWGCFLDPGRTAKIVTRSADSMISYGNAHYLQWPKYPGGSYSWVPSAGRPIPSALTLQQTRAD